MKNLVIVGAGHLGVDVYYLVKRLNRIDATWLVRGFLSDVSVDLARWGVACPVIGNIQDWNPQPNDWYFMAIGNPAAKERLVTIFKSRGARFATLISPSAYVCESARIGEGVIIDQNSFIATDVTVGNFCVIGDTTMAAGSSIGDYSNTGSYANITQGVSVGRRSQIWSHSVVLKDVGDDAVVCAGSVVLRRVRNGEKVFGNPAMPL